MVHESLPPSQLLKHNHVSNLQHQPLTLSSFHSVSC
jgi:hypothetical protein